MPWVRFDDQFPIHRKVKGLSDSAFRLHAEAIFWCARNLTDGFVHAEDVPELATARRPHRLIPELVARGNWLERNGGWQIHDYLDYQFSKAKVEQDRQAKAERQRRWMAKRKPADASTDASTGASQDATPPPPRPEGKRGRRPRASPADRQHASGAGDHRDDPLTEELTQARLDRRLECAHGTEGGLHKRSDTGESLCPFCRREEAS